MVQKANSKTSRVLLVEYGTAVTYQTAGRQHHDYNQSNSLHSKFLHLKEERQTNLSHENHSQRSYVGHV